MEQVDPLTGMSVVAQPAQPAQTINTPIPSNLQGGRQQGFITPQQQQVGKELFGNPQEYLGDKAPLFQTEYNKYNNQQLT